MARTSPQPDSAALWKLVRAQHGVVSRAQLPEHGLGKDAIQRRLAVGRLHQLWRGVYAVGRPEVSDRGRWMGAVLRCGPVALLSHSGAAALWGILVWDGSIDVSVPQRIARRPAGIQVHRRLDFDASAGAVDGIPVTSPIATLVDVASCRPEQIVERAVREADRLDLIDPNSLRESLDGLSRRPGLAPLRDLLDAQAFTLTESPLERRFLDLVRAAGLPSPKTQVRVNGYRVDFYWAELGLVVETDGLRHHRTAGQQGVDQVRDQAHTVAGMTTLRFTAAQVRYEPRRTQAVLAAVIARLQAAR